MIRYVQMAVSQELYSQIKRQAFEEDLSLGDLLEKAVVEYIKSNSSKLREEVVESNTTKLAGKK